MASLNKRLERLEGGGGGCPECRITPGARFKVYLHGIPPKPNSDPETVITATEDTPRACPACGRPYPTIRLKGLAEKPGGPAPA